MTIASDNAQYTHPRYLNLMEAAEQCVCTMDTEGRFIEAFGAVEAITGYRTEVLIGRDYSMLISPDWRHRVSDWLTIMRSAGKQPTNLCLPLQRADAAVCWVQATAIMSTDTGVPVYEILVQKLHMQAPESVSGAAPDPEDAIVQALSETSIDHETQAVIHAAMGGQRDFRLLSVLIRILQDHKHTEAALRSSQQRTHALLETLPDAMFVWSHEGIYTEVHTFDPSMLANTPDYLVGRSIRDTDLPDDIIEDVLFNIGQVLATGKAISYEYRMTIHGEQRYFGARMACLNDQEVLAVVRDITKEKLMQNELSKHIQDMMVLREIESELSGVLNMDLLLKMALNAAVQLSGASAGFIALRQDELLIPAYSIGPYQPSDLRENCRRKHTILGHVAARRAPELISNMTGDRDYYSILDSTTAMIIIPLVSQDKFIGILNLEAADDRFTVEIFQLLQLVTGRIAAMLDNAQLHHQVEEQLAEMQRLYTRLSKLEQLKTDMIRIASHDLRNPLMVISGVLEMLTLGAGNQESYLDRISQSARDMHRIISGILSLERIEEIAQNSVDELLDINLLAGVIANEKREDARIRNLDYHVQDANYPLFVLGDPLQLNEAISNLINNAIKYTPPGGRIEVTLEQKDDQVHFLVRDTGCGIPEAQQKNLFRPFFRAKIKETRTIEGTGLGLHLVKNIVERHDGQMIFSSVYHKGSTFGFSLPLQGAT